MELLNIFKKTTKTAVTANVTTLNKNQLSKVIGGGDTSDTTVDPLVTPIKGKNVKLGRPQKEDL